MWSVWGAMSVSLQMSFLETRSTSFSWTSYLGWEICTSVLGRISPLLGAGSWTSVLDLKEFWSLGPQGPTELDFIRRLSSESWDISTTVLGACCVLSRNFISSVTTWVNKLTYWKYLILFYPYTFVIFYCENLWKFCFYSSGRIWKEFDWFVLR